MPFIDIETSTVMTEKKRRRASLEQPDCEYVDQIWAGDVVLYMWITTNSSRIQDSLSCKSARRRTGVAAVVLSELRRISGSNHCFDGILALGMGNLLSVTIFGLSELPSVRWGKS